MGKRVTGEVTVAWTVELPEGKEREGLVCDDPAIQAVLDFLPQSGEVYLWGEDERPAKVFLETSEDEVNIEADER